jgi:putative addiction module antidote
MTQKIIQIGNSTGIIIPKAILDVLGLQPGTEVNVQSDLQTSSLIIQDVTKVKKTSAISPHFLTVLEKINKEYNGALRELAQK